MGVDIEFFSLSCLQNSTYVMFLIKLYQQTRHEIGIKTYRIFKLSISSLTEKLHTCNIDFFPKHDLHCSKVKRILIVLKIFDGISILQQIARIRNTSHSNRRHHSRHENKLVGYLGD